MPRAVIRIRPEPHYRRTAFVLGLERVGYTVVDGSRDRDWIPEGPTDLLVLWNRKQAFDGRLADQWERRGGTVLVVENGYLQKVDKTIYAISVGDHNGNGWFPWDPEEDRFSQLGFPLKPPVVRDHLHPVLVIGQRGIGSPTMASPPNWGEKMVEKLGKANAWLRPHPGNFKPRKPLEVDFEYARKVYIWNSSVGVRALVEGLEVVAFAPQWICKGHFDDRVQALQHMAHGQWSVEEITSGEPFARMAAADWGRKC